jgi:hypothetical protein
MCTLGRPREQGFRLNAASIRLAMGRCRLARHSTFHTQQRFLGPQLNPVGILAAGIAVQRAACSYDAMARDDDRQTVATHRLTGGPRRPGPTGMLRQFAIRQRASSWNVPAGLPTATLELAALRQRDIVKVDILTGEVAPDSRDQIREQV